MEKIIRHIETLLRRHDYVIIPDFGGFVIQHQSAVVKPESIEPPLSVVSFNSLMKVSDGLLAIEISRAESISYREATQLIESEVEKAKFSFSSKKSLECGILGTLIAHADNKILFTPSQHSHILPSNFGLETLHYYPLEAISNDDKQKVIRIKLPSARKIAKYAAAGVVALGFFLIAPEVNDTRSDFANLNPMEFFNTQETNIIPKTPMEIAEPASYVKHEVSATDSVINEKKYHVIVSCLFTHKKATKICNDYIQAGYPNSEVLPSKKVFRIAVESFKTNEEADAYVKGLKKKSSTFSETWILEE